MIMCGEEIMKKINDNRNINDNEENILMTAILFEEMTSSSNIWKPAID